MFAIKRGLECRTLKFLRLRKFESYAVNDKYPIAIINLVRVDVPGEGGGGGGGIVLLASLDKLSNGCVNNLFLFRRRPGRSVN